MPPRHETLGELKRVYAETAELSEFLAKASDRATSRTSEALFGGFVGALGLAGAFALSLVVPAAVFYIVRSSRRYIGYPARNFGLARSGKVPTGKAHRDKSNGYQRDFRKDKVASPKGSRFGEREVMAAVYLAFN